MPPPSERRVDSLKGGGGGERAAEHESATAAARRGGSPGGRGAGRGKGGGKGVPLELADLADALRRSRDRDREGRGGNDGSFASTLLSARSHTVATPVQSARRTEDISTAPRHALPRAPAAAMAHGPGAHTPGHATHDSSEGGAPADRSTGGGDRSGPPLDRSGGGGRVIDTLGLKPHKYETRHVALVVHPGGALTVRPAGGGASMTVQATPNSEPPTLKPQPQTPNPKP